MYVKRLLSFLVALVACSLPAAVSAQHTRASLILSASSAKPGDTVMAGVRLKMDKGWHTYWRYAGDAGKPTEIKWTLPPGITAGQIQWPTPEKYTLFDLYGYVYHNDAVLLVPLKVGDSAAKGALTIKANVAWMECEETCVDGEAEVEANLEIADETKASTSAATIETWQEKLPATKIDELKLRAAWLGPAVEKKRRLIFEWNVPEAPAKADFFPYGADDFDVAGETEKVSLTDGKIHLEKQVKLNKSAKDWPKTISGLLVAQDKDGKVTASWEASLPVEVTTAKSDTPVANDTASSSLLAMMGLAFLGGLILNIMPCVLPVIALKVLGFVGQAKETPQRVRQLGVIYGVGVLASFVVLAGLAIAVQRAGGLAGWSDLFQNPQFRVFITTLIILIALNLFGVFEITLGSRTMDAAGTLASKSGATGAFFNGVLATVLATPCTAPFMAGAVSFAATQPPLIILLIFLCVGLGLALPFVLLCWQPVWLKFLPKPGAWMERFKVAMGFPMLATAVWLFWVTATRMGKTGVLWFGLFLVVLAAAAWIWGEFVQRGARRKGLAIVIALSLVTLGYTVILEGTLNWRSGIRKAGIDWKPWSAEAVKKAREAGHPVFVDFTADTCINCKANLATSIDIASVRSKFEELGVVTLVADFTDKNDDIARELKAHGRNGVPLVLVYSAKVDEPPQVLPAVLRPSIVLGALDKAGQSSPKPANRAVSLSKSP